MEAYRVSRKKDPSQKPKPPPQPRVIVNDATVEALSDILVANPKGVLCHWDELSGWFGSFDSYRQNQKASRDRPAWIRLFDGGPNSIDRVQRGRIYVSNWSACLYGGIQPGPMRRLMGKITDDGLAQRFIVFFGRKAGEEADRRPEYEALSAYRRTIAHLTKMAPDPRCKVVHLSPEAQEYRELVTKVAEKVMVLPDTSDAFKGHLSKWKGIFARLVLTYHIIEAAARGLDQPGEYVSGETGGRVAKLMLDFLLPHATRFYVEVLGERKHLMHTRWIACYILSRKLEKIRAREIYRAYHEFRTESAGIDHEGIARAMMGLQVAGWAEATDKGKRDWPSKWKINPEVHSIFAERAELERQRCEVEKQKVQEAVEFLRLMPKGKGTEQKVSGTSPGESGK